MIGALSILERQPCLIAHVNDGDGPDLVIVELMRHISAANVYAKGRQSGFGVKIDKSTVARRRG